MHVEVNGTGMWFDVERLVVVPDGREMRKRPSFGGLHRFRTTNSLLYAASTGDRAPSRS